MHREGRARGGDVCLAVAHGDGGGVAGRVDVDPVGAGAEQRDRAGGRVDLEAVIVPEVAHARFERALRQSYLGGAIVERQETERALRRESNGVRTYREVGPPIGVGAEG